MSRLGEARAAAQQLLGALDQWIAELAQDKSPQASDRRSIVMQARSYVHMAQDELNRLDEE